VKSITTTVNPAMTDISVTRAASDEQEPSPDTTSVTGLRRGLEEGYLDKTRPGLYWEGGGADYNWPDPAWAQKPKIDAIERVCRVALDVPPDEPCKVTFMARGAGNRVYRVETENNQVRSQVIMRVPLPVEPGVKTLAEVTTMRFVRQNTSIPVPEIIAFDHTRDNDIGFEWIIMEMMPGMPLHRRWRSFTADQKTWVTDQIAGIQAQLITCQSFKGIGSLAPRRDPDKPPKPTRLVDPNFFWANHFRYDVPRGPFRTSHDWLLSYLKINQTEQTNYSKIVELDQDRDRIKARLKLISKLTELLPKIFPSIVHPTERTRLCHGDLNDSNILVTSDGTVTGIIDWELASARPVWLATKLPEFLRGHSRDRLPHRDDYGSDWTTKQGPWIPDSDEDSYIDSDDEVDNWIDDNEGKDPRYWADLLEYEKTQLRKVYAAKMEELWPEWKVVARDSELMNDFYDATRRSATGWVRSILRTEKWVDKVFLGNFEHRYLEYYSLGDDLCDADSDPRQKRPAQVPLPDGLDDDGCSSGSDIDALPVDVVGGGSKRDDAVEEQEG